MRLWSLHPELLDRAALVACWREGLLAQAVLTGRTTGYRHHPQLQRFRACADPPGMVVVYLRALHTEASARSYRFDLSLLGRPAEPPAKLLVTTGQLVLELEHLRTKVRLRAPEWEWRLTAAAPHPLFDVVPGPVEPWERSGGGGP